MWHNKRGALILAMAIATSTLLGGCSGSEERQVKYLERAQQSFDKEDFDKARIEVKNVLQINANNAEARFLLAQLDERDRNWPQMYGNLNAALETDPNLAKARIKLAQVLIASGQLDKASEEIDKVLKAHPDNADALATRAIVFTREKKMDEAMAQAQAALQVEPGHVNATAVLAGIYMDRDPAQAEQLIANSLKINPGNAALRLMQIRIFGKQDKNDDVIASFKALIAEHPDNLLYSSQLANFYIASERLDDAEALLRDLVKQKADSDEAKLLLVEFLGKHRSSDIALSELEQYSAAAPDDYTLRSALARIYTATQNMDKAIATYRYTVDKDKRSTDSIDARNRMAELLLIRDDRAQSEKLIKEVLELDAENADALMMRARLALVDNDPNEAIADLRTVLKGNPDSPVALALLAGAQERVGATNLALDNYQRLLQLNPDNVMALTGAARLQMAQNQLDEAQKQLEKAHALAASDLDVTRLLVDIYSRKQQWQDALNLCNDLLINKTTAPIGYHMSGLVYARKQEPAQAIDAFKKALDREPRAIEPLQMLVNTYLASRQTEPAIAYLEKHTKAYPDQAHAQEMLGVVYRQAGKLKQAEDTFDALIEKQPARVSAYRELANVYAAKGEPARIEALFDRGHQKNPKDNSFMLLLAGHYQSIGKDQQALDAYNKLNELLPRDPVVKNNLAVLLMDKFPTEENLRRAQTLTADFANSDNPIFVDTLGWLHYKMKNYPQAVVFLENAVRKSGNVPELRYHLGMAYLKNNMNAKAQEELSKATAGTAKFPGRDEAEKTLQELKEAS